MDKKIELEQVAQINDSGFLESSGRVYSTSGLSPTIKTMSGGNLEPKILEDTNELYIEANSELEKQSKPIKQNCGGGGRFAPHCWLGDNMMIVQVCC